MSVSSGMLLRFCMHTASNATRMIRVASSIWTRSRESSAVAKQARCSHRAVRTAGLLMYRLLAAENQRMPKEGGPLSRVELAVLFAVDSAGRFLRR